MKKIGFVIPWHGSKIPGGAEMALRDVSKHLSMAGADVEILSTCVKEFTGDWNKNYHKPGVTVEDGITVRRFKVRKRNVAAFDQVNVKLMNNEQITDQEERIFIREMVNSTDLCKYIAENQNEYSLFVFIPYMFGTTYYGCKACMQKAVLIPCFHEEAYIHLKIFNEVFSEVRGMIFNAEPERKLAEEVFGLDKVEKIVPGLGMDTELTFDAQRFRDKFHIQEPFVLYAGRKDVGKNIYALIRYFSEFKRRNPSDLKLVLIGGGKVEIPEDIQKDVYDLGFVDIQDKYDAYGAAVTLCQPSKHESFSYVIMESWLCERPVIVHEACDVTKDFAVRSNGGLYFKNYFEFEGCLKYYLENEEAAKQMGMQGKAFVLNNFKWDIVMNKYLEFFKKLCDEK